MVLEIPEFFGTLVFFNIGMKYTTAYDSSQSRFSGPLWPLIRNLRDPRQYRYNPPMKRGPMLHIPFKQGTGAHRNFLGQGTPGSGLGCLLFFEKPLPGQTTLAKRIYSSLSLGQLSSGLECNEACLGAPKTT